MTAFKSYRVLLVLHLKLNLGLSEARANWRSGKGRGKTLGIALGIGYALVVLTGGYMLILNAVFGNISHWQQEAVALGAAEEMGGLAGSMLGALLGTAMLVCFVFGSMSLFSAVFHARDAELYASMPLRPGAVFAAKFSMVCLYELITAAIIVLPAGVMYGVHFVPAGQVWLFWLRLIPVFLLLPVIPLTLAALPALGLTRLTRNARRRERVNLLAQIVILVAALGAQFLMSGMMQEFFSQDALRDFLRENGETISALPGWFPPAEWAGNAITGTGGTALLGAAAFLGLTAFSLVVVLQLAGRIYYKGVLTQSEVSRDPKRRPRKQRPVPPARAVALKEWRLLTRTPVYAMNTLIGPFILPLMLLLMFLTGRGGFSDALEMLDDLRLSDALLALGLGVFMAMNLMISGASTMFSREGRSLDLLASFPLSVRDILKGKILCYRIVAWAGTALSGAMLLIIGAPPWPVAAGAVMAAFAALPATEAHALRDSAAPKRHWTNETEAIKQNMNMLLGMLWVMVFLIPVLLIGLIAAAVSASVWITAGAACAVSAALWVPLRHWVSVRTERMLAGG